MESKLGEFNKKVQEILDRYNYIPPDVQEALLVAKARINVRNKRSDYEDEGMA